MSELRKALKGKIAEDVIVTHAKEGYQLAERWQPAPVSQTKVILSVLICLSLMLALFYFLFLMPKKESGLSATPPNQVNAIPEDAYSLYLKGKVAYYEQGRYRSCSSLIRTKSLYSTTSEPKLCSLVGHFWIKSTLFTVKRAERGGE